MNCSGPHGCRVSAFVNVRESFVVYTKHKSYTWSGHVQSGKEDLQTLRSDRLSFLRELFGRNDTIARILDFLLRSVLPVEEVANEYGNIIIVPTSLLLPIVISYCEIERTNATPVMCGNRAQMFQWTHDGLSQHISGGIHSSKIVPFGEVSNLLKVDENAAQFNPGTIERAVFELMRRARMIVDPYLEFSPCGDKKVDVQEAINQDTLVHALDRAFYSCLQQMNESMMSSEREEKGASGLSNPRHSLISYRIGKMAGTPEVEIGRYKTVHRDLGTNKGKQTISKSSIWSLFIELGSALSIASIPGALLDTPSRQALTLLCWNLGGSIVHSTGTQQKKKCMQAIHEIAKCISAVETHINPVVVRWISVSSAWLKEVGTREIQFSMTRPPRKGFMSLKPLFTHAECLSIVNTLRESFALFHSSISKLGDVDHRVDPNDSDRTESDSDFIRK